MEVFLVTLLFFVGFVVLMAIGLFFKRKPISGSCGGLNTLGIDKACDCEKPCSEALEAQKNSKLM